MSHDAHLGEVHIANWKNSVNEENDVDHDTQHLQMCDVKTSQLWCEGKIPVKAVEIPPECWVLGALQCSITV